MKKILVIMLALTLAIPAIGYAGSATSRWDLTIGGNEKIDIAYSNTAAGLLSDDALPQRSSLAGNDNVINKYGTWQWGVGETSLNFAIRGPDAWGAKTSAFISGDFTGVWTGGPAAYSGPGGSQLGEPDNYNTFDLMNANFTLDWGQESVVIGQEISIWGMIPTFALAPNWGNMGFGGKGLPPVAPGIWYTQKFGSSGLRAMFQVQGPQGPTGANETNGAVNNGANSQSWGPIPYLQTSWIYESPACGKVGPWDLLFGLDAIYGKQKYVFQTSTSGPVALSSQNVDEWSVMFKTLVPIIPEKNNGNKTNAWYVDANIFTGQNVGGGYYGTFGSYGALAYLRPGSTTNTATPGQPPTLGPSPYAGNYASPLAWGWEGHTQFYFTDQISFNGFYFYSYIKDSQWVANNISTSATGGVVHSIYNYTADIMYDVNPAVRLVFAYDTTRAYYAGPSTTPSAYGNSGTRHTYHFAAYYYF